MTLVDVQVKIDDGEVKAMFVDLLSRTSPAGVRHFLTAAMYPFLQKRMLQRFISEGDDAVGHWEQLADSTVNIRTIQGFNGAHPINIRTGEMASTLLGSWRIFHGDTLQIPGLTSRGIREKIRTAQFGKAETPTAARTPARPVLGVSDIDASFAMNSLMAWITTGGI